MGHSLTLPGQGVPGTEGRLLSLELNSRMLLTTLPGEVEVVPEPELPMEPQLPDAPAQPVTLWMGRAQLRGWSNVTDPLK